MHSNYKVRRPAESLPQFDVPASLRGTYPTAATSVVMKSESSTISEIPSVCRNVEPAVASHCYTPHSANENGASVGSTLDEAAPPHAAKLLWGDLTTTTATNTSVTRACHRHLDSTYEVENVGKFAKQQKSKRPNRWPFFIVLISTLEIFIFVYDYITMMKKSTQNTNSTASVGSGGGNGNGNVSSSSSSSGSGGGISLYAGVPSDSVFIYRPDRRLQVWRFVSYMLLHANGFHLGFNVVAQLLFGVPLELMHGAVRVAVIYFAGVFAGSLGTSVVDSAAYLVGASGGVYALLAAQLANICLNYERLRYGFLQLLAFIVFVFSDFIYALYTKYFGMANAPILPTVSYIAHLSGSLAGFTLGLLVLKHFGGKSKSTLLWWLAFSLCLTFIGFGVVFNLVNTMTAQSFEEQGESLKRTLLQSLGIS